MKIKSIMIAIVLAASIIFVGCEKESTLETSTAQQTTVKNQKMTLSQSKETNKQFFFDNYRLEVNKEYITVYLDNQFQYNLNISGLNYEISVGEENAFIINNLNKKEENIRVYDIVRTEEGSGYFDLETSNGLVLKDIGFNNNYEKVVSCGACIRIIVGALLTLGGDDEGPCESAVETVAKYCEDGNINVEIDEGWFGTECDVSCIR